MPKYFVEIKETRILAFEILAATEEEAKEIAFESDESITDQFDERVHHGCTKIED